MNDLHVTLKTHSRAVATVDAVTEQHVTIAIEPTAQWNAEGLNKLAAMLKGVAATLAATALLVGFMTVADANDWTPWSHGFDAEAYTITDIP